MPARRFIGAALAVVACGCSLTGERPTANQHATPTFVAEPVPAVVADRMRKFSWREGCPVPISQLRLLHVTHLDQKGAERVGELIVHAAVAEEVVTIFRALYQARFPIEKMRIIDEYEGSDDRSMEDNNTSAFNCRAKTGKPNEYSLHSYGVAIDINPKINPYFRRTPNGPTAIAPASGAPYLDRTKSVPGLIRVGEPVHDSFVRRGWQWGGSWSDRVDYQHFQKPAVVGF